MMKTAIVLAAVVQVRGPLTQRGLTQLPPPPPSPPPPPARSGRSHGMLGALRSHWICLGVKPRGGRLPAKLFGTAMRSSACQPLQDYQPAAVRSLLPSFLQAAAEQGTGILRACCKSEQATVHESFLEILGPAAEAGETSSPRKES